MAAWSRATSLCTGLARVRGVCRGSAALRSTIECAISPICSDAICSRSSRSAAWCPESFSWPLWPADGGVCRSPVSPASLVVSALYLPLMLCIVVFFGDTLDGRVGWWTWPFLFCVLLAIGFVRRQVFNFQQEPKPADGTRPIHVPLRKVGKVAPRDRIPLGLFYLPLIASWIRFASRYRSLKRCRRSPIRAIRWEGCGANRKAAICSTSQRTSDDGSPIL